MAERASATLLGFAIAASGAVVPVLLIVLLAVGFTRSQEPGGLAARHADRHVSVRAVAALKTFEHAIVKRRAVTAGPPSAAELLAGVPQCRAAWDGHPGPFERIRRALARTDTEPPSPAQRLSAHLADLDAALRDFSTGGNRRVSEAVGFDAARWFDAVALAMQQPVEAPAYPGRAFAVQCPDIAGAAAMLTRSNARMLAALSWRGTEVARVVDRWHPDQFVEITARMVARANPWGGLPGCIYLGNAVQAAAATTPAYFVTSAHAPDERVCTRPEMFAMAGDIGDESPPRPIAGEATPELALADDRWKVPPSLDALLQPLSTLRRPSGELYRLYTDETVTAGDAPTGYGFGANRITVGGAEVDVGFSVDLTIDPATQALAQMTAACYTGRQDVCGALGIARSEDNGQARRASDARRCHGPDGGGRGDRCRDRAHRGVGGCTFAVHAPRVRRSGTRRPAATSACPMRRAFAPMPSSTPPSFTMRCPPRSSSPSWPRHFSRIRSWARAGSPRSARG